MKEASVIITEKSKVSRMIARALAPETFDEREYCSLEHRDIVSLRTKQDRKRIIALEDIGCAVLLPDYNDPRNRRFKESSFNYICTYDCLKCGFIVQHLDAMGMKHARSTIKRLSFLREQAKRNGGQNDRPFESLSYYLIERDEEFIIIMDTEGTPYHFRANGIKLPNASFATLEDMVVSSASWDDLERNLDHIQEARVTFGRSDETKESYPNREEKDLYIEPKSHKARQFLLNTVLAKRFLPSVENTRIALRRVIAATDYDIAGSSIFYSVILNANHYLRNNLHKKSDKFSRVSEIN